MLKFQFKKVNNRTFIVHLFAPPMIDFLVHIGWSYFLTKIASFWQELAVIFNATTKVALFLGLARFIIHALPPLDFTIFLYFSA